MDSSEWSCCQNYMFGHRDRAASTGNGSARKREDDTLQVGVTIKGLQAVTLPKDPPKSPLSLCFNNQVQSNIWVGWLWAAISQFTQNYVFRHQVSWEEPHMEVHYFSSVSCSISTFGFSTFWFFSTLKTESLLYLWMLLRFPHVLLIHAPAHRPVPNLGLELEVKSSSDKD